jgi:hypothetical protein
LLHPPDQSSGSVFSFNVGGGYGDAANPCKRAFVGPDGPYGTQSDDGESGGGYEYGSESRPQSRRLSVMELCNDDSGLEQRLTSSVRLSAIVRDGSAERERERPTTTNGLVSRASALVIHDEDNGQQQQS